MKPTFNVTPEAPRLTLRLSSTPRGARLARRLAVDQLTRWRLPTDGPLAWAVATVTAELALNAVTHGRTPGRDFGLCVRLLTDTIRIEVSDTRPDRYPVLVPPDDTAEQGRGLLLVDALTSNWGCVPRGTCAKTVWADIPR
ncbi:hypothetical protein SRB5_36440 [Streptomyces sp. RB5]|uniref:Histidine kinase/HSP90-like ATPase domain-containing protein n=1 Tax=Streptomyces smaragdinus TaxID=2585196 RepID=A0A7K0CJ68_9ACTN|nr:ATP-binding protein [Streptomyces smaragdinus]MQY13496.1 hypothetical protein [Streptomyces smaragdinus]